MDPLKVPAPQETKLHFLDYWRIIRIRKTVILAVFLLVVITATLVTFILPESYSSIARIKVEKDQSDISGLVQLAAHWGAIILVGALIAAKVPFWPLQHCLGCDVRRSRYGASLIAAAARIDFGTAPRGRC